MQGVFGMFLQAAIPVLCSERVETADEVVADKRVQAQAASSKSCEATYPTASAAVQSGLLHYTRFGNRFQSRCIGTISNLDAFAGPTQRIDSRLGHGEKMRPTTITQDKCHLSPAPQEYSAPKLPVAQSRLLDSSLFPSGLHRSWHV
jgi:hypothetical protein